MADLERTREARERIVEYAGANPDDTPGFAGAALRVNGESTGVERDFGVTVLSRIGEDLPPRYAGNITETLATAGLSDVEVTYEHIGATPKAR